MIFAVLFAGFGEEPALCFVVFFRELDLGFIWNSSIKARVSLKAWRGVKKFSFCAKSLELPGRAMKSRMKGADVKDVV